jgi:hypothetical protein
MTKLICRSFAFLLSVASCASYAASELQNYVQQCQAELGFNASEVTSLDCSKGVRFAGGGKSPINDFLVYKKVNNSVDLTAACRWLSGGNTAASVELIIHNRQNGSTCFFSAKDQPENPTRPVSSLIVAPTNFSPIHNRLTNPNADDYWVQPSELNNKRLLSDANGQPHPPGFTDSARCVGCHVEGPYIASSNIAPYLAKYGLLNDGHDTVADMTAAKRYHAVGSSSYNNPSDPNNLSAFKAWDSIIFGNIPTDPVTKKPLSDCSGACHSIGRNSMIGSLSFPGDTTATLLPSLQADIAQLSGFGMPPTAEDSPFRWINRDNLADVIDIETFTASKVNFPVTQYNCGVPTVIEAHAVGTNLVFSSDKINSIPDKLRAFNLRDGLLCLDADQPAGKKCSNYAFSYQCDDQGMGTAIWQNDTNANDDGDHEERTPALTAQIRAACGGKDPVGITAYVVVNNSYGVGIQGPNDKLQQFSPTGLVCKNSDQTNGQSCSNYVARYRGCLSSSQTYLAKLKNAWISPPTFGDRYLTATNNVSGSETRAQANNYQYPSQDWIVEKIPGGNTVRLKDVWSGKYLTATNNNDLATVVVNNSDTTLMRQQWIIETYNDTEVRIRNVGSSRYLTVGNYNGDPYYAPILSQSLSNQNWASQRWVVQ